MQAESRQVMVCVTAQKTCEKLIRAGLELAHGGTLFAVHVASPGAALLGSRSESDALEFLYSTARKYNADMHMLRSADPIATIISFAQTNHIDVVVVGRTNGKNGDSFAKSLQARLSNVAVHAVYPEN